jgi:flavin-dependent dehydrogenase
MIERADAVIVGAGPAGAVTALLLARAGHDVLLLERARFPRAKPCGDCLSAGATAVLDRIGVLDRVRALPHGRLAGWRIAAPGGTHFTGTIRNPPGYALAVERAALDNELAGAARRAGARLLHGARVTGVLRSGSGAVHGVALADREVRARLVVGADGLRSAIAARLGAVQHQVAPRKLSFTLHPPIPGHGLGHGEMHILEHGCVGVAPVDLAGRCNVTVVVDAAHFAACGRSARNIIAAMTRRVDTLRSDAAQAAIAAAPLLASGPFHRPVRRVTFDGAALVGDAAGYYDPFTGQGVCHALLTAELLARTADSALRNNDCSTTALAPYARALYRLLDTPRRLQRAVEAVTASPRTANRAIALLRDAPLAADTLIAVIGHTAPARSLVAPRVLADLLLPDLRRTAC